MKSILKLRIDDHQDSVELCYYLGLVHEKYFFYYGNYGHEHAYRYNYPCVFTVSGNQYSHERYDGQKVMSFKEF